MAISKGTIACIAMRNLGGIAWGVRWGLSDLRITDKIFGRYIDQCCNVVYDPEGDKIAVTYTFMPAEYSFTVYELRMKLDGHQSLVVSYFVTAARLLACFFGSVVIRVILSASTNDEMLYFKHEERGVLDVSQTEQAANP